MVLVYITLYNLLSNVPDSFVSFPKHVFLSLFYWEQYVSGNTDHIEYEIKSID